MSQPISSALSRIDFDELERLAVAVSGGGDSVALLLALSAAIKSGDHRTKLTAITVDHGLRPESAGESRRVSELCSKIGIEHASVKWNPSTNRTTGVSAAARSARYRLLTEKAAEINVNAIVTGHTLDDQVETVAMRKARGGLRGIAGMAPLTLANLSIWVARPLLDVSRDELRGYLRERGQDWIDDPSNEDHRYERIRIRETLLKEPEKKKILQTLADNAATERLILQQKAARLIEAHARLPAPGLCTLDIHALDRDNDAAFLLAFRALLAVLGGRDHFVDDARAKQAATAIMDGQKRLNISGCVVEMMQDEFRIYRENRRDTLHPVEPVPGLVWDRRWRLRNPVQGAAKIAASSQLSEENISENGVERRYHTAAATLPALIDHNGNRIEMPFHDAFEPVLAPWLDFLPGFDFRLAEKINSLIGGRNLPVLSDGLKRLMAF